MPVIGGDVVAKNIVAFGGGFLKHVNKTMNIVRKDVDEEITKNMSLSDHSIADLASMGHPYKIGGVVPHSPSWLVHKHSGRLVESKESGVEKASITFGKLSASAWIRLDENDAEYAVFIIYGTRKMIPRDVMQGSIDVKRGDVQRILTGNLRDFVFHYDSRRTQI